jgi:signal transduction histidine kinase/CheY-like chemotaxis protein
MTSEQSGPGTAGDRFRSIVAEADEGIIVLEADGRISYANPAAEFLLGCPGEELVGEMFGRPLTTADRRTVVNVVPGDGRPRVVELRIEPLPAGGDGLLLRLRDVTAFHQEVATAREQVRRRDEFLAMLSHELRNPLAGIQSAAMILGHDAATAAIRRDATEILDRQFRHLTRMLDDLLDVARISRGKLEVRMARAELNRLVRDAAEAVAPLVARRRHALLVDVPRDRLWIWADPTRLEQVVVNLLTNAAKFTPPGGNIAVTVTADGTTAEVHVRDDGPGIPPDLLPHVFEPFVQGRQAIERTDGGLGIGLALAHTIVGLHGGGISARPNDGAPGVTFRVVLPVLAAEAEPPADADPADAAARPLRILVVEDNDDSRRMLREALRLDGHEVFEAGDGLGGLAAVIEQSPDVALVDIGLPNLDGYELARRARRDPRGGQARLVALTGYGTPQDVQACREAGFDAHLLKPLRYPDLCRLLGEYRAAGRPGGK